MRGEVVETSYWAWKAHILPLDHPRASPGSGNDPEFCPPQGHVLPLDQPGHADAS